MKQIGPNAIWALGLALELAACSAGPGGQPSATGTGQPSAAPSAAGSDGAGAAGIDGDWILVAGTGPDGAIPLVAGAEITLSIHGEDVGGRAACNQYGGKVAAAGNLIHFGMMSVTEMACAEPIMASEVAYHAALAVVERVARQGDRLTLSGDEVQLQFSLVPPEADAPLAGTDWRLTTLVVGDVASSVQGEPSLLLRADGTFEATTGCRVLSGAYEVTGGQLRVTNLVPHAPVTCEPGIAPQDAQIAGVLEDARVSVEGRTLWLTHGANGLVYGAADVTGG